MEDIIRSQMETFLGSTEEDGLWWTSRARVLGEKGGKEKIGWCGILRGPSKRHMYKLLT